MRRIKTISFLPSAAVDVFLKNFCRASIEEHVRLKVFLFFVFVASFVRSFGHCNYREFVSSSDSLALRVISASLRSLRYR